MYMLAYHIMELHHSFLFMELVVVKIWRHQLHHKGTYKYCKTVWYHLFSQRWMTKFTGHCFNKTMRLPTLPKKPLLTLMAPLSGCSNGPPNLLTCLQLKMHGHSCRKKWISQESHLLTNLSCCYKAIGLKSWM